MSTKKFIVFAILYLIVGIFFVIYYFKHKDKYKNKFGYNGFFFSILLYYLIIPFIMFIKIDKFILYEAFRGIYGNNSIYKYVYNAPTMYILFALLLVIIFYISFNIGYNFSLAKDRILYVDINEKKLEKSIKFFIYFSFIVGGISLLAFFYSFGGVRRALSMAEYLRSFSNEASDVIGLSSLLLISSRLITITPFLLSYYMEKYKGRKYSLYYIFIFLISFVLSILYYLYNAGRFPMVCFFLAIFYIFIRNKVKKPWTLIIILGIIGLPMLDVLSNLFVFFSTGTMAKVTINYYKYIYDFFFPIRNVVNVIPLSHLYGLKFFIDIPLGFLDLLPGFSVTPAYYVTSQYFHGVNWKSIGGIPTDAITFGFFQFNILGVALFSMLLGFIIQKIDYRLDKFKNNCKYYIGSYFTMVCFSLVNNSDPTSFIKGQFFFIIIYIVLILSTKRKVNE